MVYLVTLGDSPNIAAKDLTYVRSPTPKCKYIWKARE